MCDKDHGVWTNISTTLFRWSTDSKRLKEIIGDHWRCRSTITAFGRRSSSRSWSRVSEAGADADHWSEIFRHRKNSWFLMGHPRKNIYKHKLRFSTGKPSSNGGIVHCHVWAYPHTRCQKHRTFQASAHSHHGLCARAVVHEPHDVSKGWLVVSTSGQGQGARGGPGNSLKLVEKSSAMPWLKKVDDQSRETSLLHVQTSNDNISIHFSHGLSVEMEAYDSDIKLYSDALQLQGICCDSIFHSLLLFSWLTIWLASIPTQSTEDNLTSAAMCC